MIKISQQRLWSFIGIFIIALVLSIPFYSADALATSLQVTHNSGNADISKFMDAKGDTWEVDALISGLENGTTVNPEDVKININDNERSFNSCSDDALGVLCKYISPLMDGVKETSYKFSVSYSYPSVLGINKTASDSDDINADGSAPQVTGLIASQDEEGKVHLSFQVSDKYEGKPFVGVKSIDVLDAESGQVLDRIDNLTQGKESYNYASDRGKNGILETPLSGEGTKRIKVVAEDWLGHKTINPPQVSFLGDFVKPIIVTESLNLTTLGKFKGVVDQTTSVNIDVRGEKFTPSVYASADQTSLDGDQAVCVPDEQTEQLWHCNWNDVLVKGTAPKDIEFTVIAKDQNNNVEQAKIVKSYVEDVTPPEAVFFGPQREYNGAYYLSEGKQRIYLKVQEQGSGVDETTVSANLGGITGDSNPVAPENCTKSPDEGTTNCYWDVDARFTSTNSVSISLFKFEDLAGNLGKGISSDINLDATAPIIEKLEFYGTSDAGDHNYFQSGDRIKIKAVVTEVSGLNFLVNLNGLINDAENLFPETDKTLWFDQPAGWQVLKEDNCQRKEGQWLCTIETTSLKSGPANNQRVEVMITDTGGNNAKSWPDAKNVEKVNDGIYKFDLLGLSTEDKPDYWATGSVTPGLSFIDLDTTQLAYTRMPLTVQLKSDNPQAKILSVQLLKDSCVAKEGTPAPQISRSLSYGGSFAEGQDSPASFTLMLEFAPFDGRTLFATSLNPVFTEANAEYTCKAQIYSKVGKNALSSAEIQEITVKVPFGFSTLGSVDENLADLVNAAWNTDFMIEFANALHYVNLAITWIRFILEAVMIIYEVLTLFTGIQELYALSAEQAEDIGDAALGTGEAIGKALRGQCSVLQIKGGTLHEYVKYIQIPLQILSCTPNAEGYESLGWYAQYQKTVLDIYNRATLRTGTLIETGKEGDKSYIPIPGLGVPAGSLYDNIYLSIIGLCVPGVVYNLEKAREIHCRRIVCYGREVPQGIATVESCNDLYDLQMCEYVYGPMFDMVPFLGALTQIGKMIKSMFTSPVGLINVAEILMCGLTCFIKGSGLVKACNWIRQFTKSLDIVE